MRLTVATPRALPFELSQLGAIAVPWQLAHQFVFPSDRECIPVALHQKVERFWRTANTTKHMAACMACRQFEFGFTGAAVPI